MFIGERFQELYREPGQSASLSPTMIPYGKKKNPRFVAYPAKTPFPAPGQGTGNSERDARRYTAK
jgi:hypothetical protein